MRVVRVAGTEQRGRLNVRNKRNSEVRGGSSCLQARNREDV